MKNKVILAIFFGAVILFQTSCKTEFEKIRAEGDAKVWYKKAFEYYDAEEYFKAQTMFELVISSLRGKVEAEKVYFFYAYSHYHQQKYILSSYYFKNFSNTFPNSSYREEADFMTAYANYKLSPTYRLDQSYTLKSIEGLQLFTNTWPNSKRISECNKLIDEMRIKLEQKAFAEAKLYFDVRQYQSATHSFENLLKEFPDSPNVERVRFMITKASYLLAQNSVVDKQQDRFEQTIQNVEEFTNRYPASSFLKEIEDIRKNSSKQLKSIVNVRY